MGQGPEASFGEHVSRYPKEYLEDMAVAFMNRRPGARDVHSKQALQIRLRAELLPK